MYSWTSEHPTAFHWCVCGKLLLDIVIVLNLKEKSTNKIKYWFVVVVLLPALVTGCGSKDVLVKGSSTQSYMAHKIAYFSFQPGRQLGLQRKQGESSCLPGWKETT